MEMRLEKNNCNLFRKTRNFYSVTPRLKLSDSDSLSNLNSGDSEAIRLGLSVKFQFGGYSEALRLGLSVKFQFGGVF